MKTEQQVIDDTVSVSKRTMDIFGGYSPEEQLKWLREAFYTNQTNLALLRWRLERLRNLTIKLLNDKQSLSVEEARTLKVCRLCLQPTDVINTKTGSLILEYGNEYAHEMCLAEVEKEDFDYELTEKDLIEDLPEDNSVSVTFTCAPEKEESPSEPLDISKVTPPQEQTSSVQDFRSTSKEDDSSCTVDRTPAGVQLEYWGEYPVREDIGQVQESLEKSLQSMEEMNKKIDDVLNVDILKKTCEVYNRQEAERWKAYEIAR